MCHSLNGHETPPSDSGARLPGGKCLAENVRVGGYCVDEWHVIQVVNFHLQRVDFL